MSPVPGHGCTRGCRGDAVRRLPADFDAAGQPRFRSVPYPVAPGARMLAHQANGDGVYLNRATGCTIHPHKPAMAPRHGLPPRRPPELDPREETA